MTLERLLVVTRRASTLVQRIRRAAEHPGADADGLVMTAELTALEHDIEELIRVVQNKAMTAYVSRMPRRVLADLKAPIVERSLPQSSDLDHGVHVQRIELGAARR